VKIPGQIAFTLPILLISAGIYFSGQYLQNKSDEKLAKVEVQETKIESKTIEKKENLKQKFSNILLPDNQKGVSSAYKFPSVSRVKVGVAYEMNENKVLWTKEANKSVPIASLTKCLTIFTVLDLIKNNPKFSLLDEIKISKSAMQTSSSVFLRKYPKSTVSIKELLITAMVKSSNDSCQLLAEYFGNGDPKKFIDIMNIKAQQLGMKETRISNSHGLPFSRENPKLDNHSSMNDLLNLTKIIIKEYPFVLKWTSTRSLSYPEKSSKPVRLNNTNPLLPVKGVNGFKTGFTLNAGWCQILTCRSKGKFYFIAITGCPSKNSRDVTMRALMNWAVRTQ
jgi:D-alanyl-D-alanine carboxypeptidase